ncbi:MAG: CsgG/HfaB family protein [Oligoflexia bacterium]|jgi:hypothetical protein
MNRVLAGVAILLFFSACQRSPAFRRDQEFYRDNPSYYDKSAKTRSATQKVESQGQPKKRVVVLDFWNDTPVKNSKLGSFGADELRRGLFQTQRLIVPKDVRLEYTTLDFIQTDRQGDRQGGGEHVRVAQLIREGRKLGVAVIAIGRIGKVVFRQRGDEVGVLRQTQSLAAAEVEIKLFDVAAGRELLSVSKSGEASSNALVGFEAHNQQSPEFRSEMLMLAVRDAVGQVVPDVVRSVEKLSWEGRIAKIVGPKVYVTAGKASGLIAGDILKVLTAGEEIYDQVTGAYLGRTPGTLKGTLEVKDFLGQDGAVAEIHTGGNFQAGDTVQLY